MAVVSAGSAASKGTKRKAAPHLLANTTPARLSKRTVSKTTTAAELESVAATEEKRKESAEAEADPGDILSLPLIRRLEKDAIASRQHINHITVLLAHVEQHQQQQQLESASSPSSASLHSTTAAYQSLYRILEHYAEAGELSLVSGSAGSSASLTGQLRHWLQSQYNRYVACSLSLLEQPYGPLQLSALHALMALVRLPTAAVSADTAASLLTAGIFASVVNATLSSPHYAAIHETLTAQYLSPYIDLRLFALRAIKASVKEAALHNSRVATSDKLRDHSAVSVPSFPDTTLHNSLTMLLELSKPDTAAPSSSFTNATVSSSAFGSTLSATYLAFLSLPHTPATYKRILEHLDSHIVPNVVNPLLLADFLTDSYHIGGIVSLLALASLFHLIAKYNLDYPHFYHKLYTLCTPALTLSKHRSRFIVLLSRFLSSAYLPSSLVAAFCKRLARLAMVGGGGVDSSVELMRLVWGLVRRNPGVSGMVWGQREVQREKEGRMESLTDFLVKRQTELAENGDKRKESSAETDKEGRSAALDDMFDDSLSDDEYELATTAAAGKGGSGRTDPLTAIQSSSLSSASPAASTASSPATSFTEDPFLALLDDPAACNATASTLWELRTLTQHYAPAVRSLASLFYATNAPKGELDAVSVGKVGESEGYNGMMRKEMERRKNQKVAATFGKRATLFEQGDIVSSNFTLS